MQNPASRSRAVATQQTTNRARPAQQTSTTTGARPSMPRQPDGTTTTALAQSLVAGALRKRPPLPDVPQRAGVPGKPAPVATVPAASPVASEGRRQRVRKETRAQLLDRLTNPLISLHEASILLRVCPATVRRYSNAGLLSHVRTAGGQRRFYLKDVLTLSRQEDARRRR